jgi:hypothetical protein
VCVCVCVVFVCIVWLCFVCVLCMCVGVCVCLGERKLHLLCSVMSAVPVPSKNSLEMIDDIMYSGVLCGLYN